MADSPEQALRALPAVTAVLKRPKIAELVAAHGHAAVVRAVRDEVAAARARVLAGGGPPDVDDGAVVARVDAAARGSLRPVLNATGVVVHTNLGRAPLAREALDAAAAVGGGYSTLEYDLAAGKRGSRHAHAVERLVELTSAEDAVVVNNNAAALVLALATWAAGKEVVVSRGELVEIGGGFRVPDILACSGARLVEVGTTNRTHAADYERAIGPQTAMVLKVHRSNFAMVGFTKEVEIEELVAIARARGTFVMYDAGSGCLEPVAGASGEPPLSAAVKAGADIVTFSGDKLLGGPQAGVAVGSTARIAPMRKHPLFRALRPDKLCLAALVATLDLWRAAPGRVPLARMIHASVAELEARAQRLAARIATQGWVVDVVPSAGRIGGGAAPTKVLEGRAVRVRAAGGGDAAAALAARLREGDPPVVAHIEEGAVLLDPRCVDEADDVTLATATAAAMASLA
jgi:L-seryl-tRNA(Ser) seleniumtransferase